MEDKVCVNLDIRFIISALVFFNHLNNEALDASVEISFFLCEDTVIQKVILMGNTATLNGKNPYTVFRRKGQVFLLLPEDHALLDFLKENNHYMQYFFFYKQGRNITSSGNRLMCREALIQVDDYQLCIFSKCICVL